MTSFTNVDNGMRATPTMLLESLYASRASDQVPPPTTPEPLSQLSHSLSQDTELSRLASMVLSLSPSTPVRSNLDPNAAPVATPEKLASTFNSPVTAAVDAPFGALPPLDSSFFSNQLSPPPRHIEDILNPLHGLFLDTEKDISIIDPIVRYDDTEEGNRQRNEALYKYAQHNSKLPFYIPLSERLGEDDVDGDEATQLEYTGDVPSATVDPALLMQSPACGGRRKERMKEGTEKAYVYGDGYDDSDSDPTPPSSTNGLHPPRAPSQQGWITHNKWALQDYANRQVSPPDGKRVSVRLTEPAQVIGGMLEALNTAGSAHGEGSGNESETGLDEEKATETQNEMPLLENLVELKALALNYLRRRLGIRYAEREVGMLLLIICSNFYEAHMQLFEAICKRATENMHARRASQLATVDFSFGFDYYLSQEIPFFVKADHRIRNTRKAISANGQHLLPRLLPDRMQLEPHITRYGRATKLTEQAKAKAEAELHKLEKPPSKKAVPRPRKPATVEVKRHRITRKKLRATATVQRRPGLRADKFSLIKSATATDRVMTRRAAAASSSSSSGGDVTMKDGTRDAAMTLRKRKEKL